MKKIIQLPFTRKLEENLRLYPQFIQVIMGPRQVGKTTSTLKFLEDDYKKPYHFVSAEKMTGNGVTWITDAWQKARQEKSLLVIDEIPKVENWAEIIKRLWDEDKRLKKSIQCVLLGSSSLELQFGMTESLTGRFQTIPAYHWNFQESKAGYKLTFEEFIKFGGYPGSYDLRKNTLDWSQYVRNSIIDTVVEKDILLNHKVKSPALFKQCFDLLISYPAQELSYTKLLGQLQDKGNTDVVKYYIRLFEGAFLIKALEKFSTNSIKKRSSSPKILPLCPAFSYINDLEQYSGEMKGHVFEAIVGSALNRLGLELFYWRDGNHEVDFILKFGKRIWAIEVKSGRRKKMEGLNQFIKSFPKAIPVVITFENYFDFENDPHGFLGIM